MRKSAGPRKPRKDWHRLRKNVRRAGSRIRLYADMSGSTRLRGGLTGLVMMVPIAGKPSLGAQPAVSPQEAYEIGLEAYLYFYPLVLMDITRAQMTNVPPGGLLRTRPMNAFIQVRAFPTPDAKTVVKPNFDTLYSVTWLDVSKERPSSSPYRRSRTALLCSR